MLTRIIRIVIVLAVLSAMFLIGILIHSTLYCNQGSSYHYLDNPNYTKRLDLFASDRTPKTIVMLGDSHTSRADWEGLLGRSDVANQGIGSDITEGFLNRIDEVLKVCPKICFIEGGVNDIAREVPFDEIINNLNLVIRTLEADSITPVLTTVTYVSRDYRRAGLFNRNVKRLNKNLHTLAALNDLYIIDLNPLLSNGKYLLKAYSEPDGLHLRLEAYKIWRNEIVKILAQEGY